jgi:hypothetical protein
MCGAQTLNFLFYLPKQSQAPKYEELLIAEIVKPKVAEVVWLSYQIFIGVLPDWPEVDAST